MIAPTVSPAANPVRHLPDMRDRNDVDCRLRQAVVRWLSDFIGGYGYDWLEVPILEATELFLRKSGGALASQMYSFTDPGSNAVSLRPEFTSAIMRHYLESYAGSLELPLVRWQYAGPVFRYDPDNATGSGQFTQVGAELIGQDNAVADAELLALAAGAPALLGIRNYHVRLADLGVLDSVLDTVGMSERARSFIVANMNRIGDDGANIAGILRRAAELRIISGGELPDDESDLAAAVAGLPDAAARGVLAGLMRWRGAGGSPIGQRTPDEIIDRLLHKMRGGDDPDAVARGLALAGRLAAVNGAPDAALAQARAVVADAGADPTAVNRLSELVTSVAGAPNLASRLVIDFALARGIAYYNGIIFEIMQDDGALLGGGGRYDPLARALGSPRDVPALGFACTLETLLDAMPAPDASGTTGSLYSAV